MKNRKILILGGKGKTGRRVVEKLTWSGYKNIRIGSRSETPAFDWDNSKTWPGAIEGMDTVYITFQPDLAIPGAADTIQKFASLASANGITKMVLLSGRGEKEAQACEQIVMNTAATWTIIRASWFNQNFSESFFLDPILAGYVALPRAEALEPFIDANDIADVVVKALIEDKHAEQIYELTGPRLLTLPEITSEIARITQREIQFEPLTLEAYVKMLQEHQLSDELIWLINYLFTELLDGRNASVTNDVEKVLGRKAKDIAEYVKETAATGIWNPDKSNS